MKWISGAQAQRALDQAALDHLGLPEAALMETASRGVAEVVRARFLAEARRGVLVLAGSGNNGGDGYAVARWLFAWGLPVRLVRLEPPRTPACRVQAEVARRVGIPIQTGVAALPGLDGLIIDALLGTGLTRPVEGEAAAALEAIHRHGAPIVAVDLPSGMAADTGALLGPVPVCACTVTFARMKPAFFHQSGAERAGEVVLIDLGLEVARHLVEPPEAEMPEASDLAPLWPRRGSFDHKRRSGRLLVVAGSLSLAGAAVLCCHAALRAGAGLVTLATPGGALPRMSSLAPEVMVRPLGSGPQLLALDLDPSDFDAVVVGPGLGRPLEAEVKLQLRTWWQRLVVPLVYDADALACAEGPGPAARVITPHAGEAATLLGVEPSVIQKDRFRAARDLADSRVAVLKGRYSLVAAPGERLSVNPTGSSILATGGTGDVLAGVVGALLARGATARDAARLAAWVHGRAADQLEALRVQGWLASDIVHQVPSAIADLVGGEA